MKQESISDEQRADLDIIADAINQPRHVVVRYAIDDFIKKYRTADSDPFKALFLNSVISK